MTYKTDKSTIAKNTIYLYVRQIVIVLITLFSIRVVLNNLGVVDYGIYSVVAGVVTLCSFLTTSMASATQRYFSFALGKDDDSTLKQTFCVNLVIYVAIGALALLALESIGLWFVQEHLSLPPEKYATAQALYQYSIVTLIFGIFSAPFLAIIISHERMQYFAAISIMEAILKLVAAISLSVYGGDRLEFYGLLLLAVSIFVFLAYFVVCIKSFKECQFKQWYWNQKLFSDIIAFTGWTLFGQFTTVVRMQGVTILVNQFFSPATAAARAIAISVSSQVSAFSNAFNTGLYPSIIKNHAAGNTKELHDIVFVGSKFTFFLMWVFTLPLIVGMELVLSLWLGDPPQFAVLFTQLAMVEMLIMSISLPLATAARAPGKMRGYELTLGIMQLLIIVIAYFTLKLGYPAYSVFVIAIVMNLLMFLVRLLIVSRLIALSTLNYVRVVLKPVFWAVIFPTSLVIMVGDYCKGSDILQFAYLILVFFAAVTSVIYLGMNTSTRREFFNVINNKLRTKLGAK
ncbi:lipopolysaccharide biosynthesis protein [Vibrio jasicida]|uniref:lipopolysaccharide biosynthesis protein n=1 Tax=Vibrio jasicida TaxID=766224 RepID=UPI0003A6A5E6|nr:polysaccharide biosynthesis protein [Vibrio jasicida]